MSRTMWMGGKERAVLGRMRDRAAGGERRAGRYPLGLVVGLVASVWAGGLMAPALAEEEKAARSLRAVLDSIERPTITGVMDAPEVLTVGRAEIRPRAGSRLSVLSIDDGRQVGYLLEGAAQLTYRVEDRFSVAPARLNLKEAKGLDVKEADGLLVTSTGLTGAAVWGWDLDLGDGPVEPVTGRELPKWLVRILDAKYSNNPGRDLLASDWHGDPGFRWALFRAEGEDLVLDVDPRPLSRTEALARLYELPGMSRNEAWERRYLLPLTSQPIDRPWWEAEDIEFLATETELDVVNAEGMHVKVETRTRIQSRRDGLRLLPMQLLSGVFDDNDWRPYRVLGLTVDGQPAAYVHRGRELLIALPEPMQSGDSIWLEVESAGEILRRPSGDNYWRLGFSSWYPRPGAGGAAWAEYRVSAQVPAPYRVFAGGELLESEDGVRDESGNEVSRVSTHLEGPMQHMVVIAGKYRTFTKELGGNRIHVSSYASVKEKEADRVGQLVLSMMDCLGVWLGVPYPFQDLQVVEVNQWGWAQAPPGVIFVTQEAFLTRASAQLGDNTRSLAAIFSRGINERVAHEVAHAWFPHVAKVVRGEENWLSESLADYASAVCLEQRMANKRKAKQLFERQLGDWKNYSKEAGDATSVYLANHLAGFDDAPRIRYQLLYGRGPLVLHAI
ncbi:MAG: hypothetical protein MI919_29210, partial [Holophagales bacterium]|nr:hypothetical protein [Holophagales bacterium]